VTALAVAAIVASCGGSDSGGNDAAPGSTAAATENADSTESAAVTDAPVTSGTESSGAGGDTPDCDAIFSMAEIEEFFAEPVELTEETNDSLGQLVCTWESVEDPDDMEDLAFKLLTVQFYSGSPIDAAAFFDPSIFESVTTIEGVGDLAYSSDLLGTDFYFLDEPVGGSLSYSEVDMGDTDAPKLHTRADVEQLLRTFHDRVT
jgi:hypothetical protein